MKDYAKQLIEENPLFEKLSRQEEILWINDKYLPFDMTDGLSQLVVSEEDMIDAQARLERFAPFIKACFPETEATNGIIESPLQKDSTPYRSVLREIWDFPSGSAVRP